MTATLTVIENEVCNALDVSFGELHSQSRLERIATARQIMYYLSKMLTHMTQEEIGEFLGRTGSSVCIGKQRLRDRMDVDKPFAALVEQIRLRAEARLQEKPTHDNPTGH